MDRRLSRRLRRYFPTQYLIPVILLFGTSFGCLIALLIHTTAVQDHMEKEREVELLANGFASTAAIVVHDLQDYARWDDAVRHLVHSFDPAWADDNISTYLGVVQGYTYLLLLDERGRVIYAVTGGHRRAPGFDPARVLGKGFVAAARRVQAEGSGGKGTIGGFTEVDGKIYVFSVAAILPLTSKVSLPRGPRRALVIANLIDQRFLNMIAKDHRLPLLRLTPGLAGARNGLPLIGAGGETVGHVTWSSHAPGTELRRLILPAFGVIGLIALGAAALILRRARSGIDALRGSEARALHQALHDPLTALGNRRAMIEQVEACRGAVALLYMDLDGFKETNDVYGHAAGDALLVEAGRRIAAAAGRAALVARSGGDEFAIVLEEPAPGQAERICEAVLTSFHAPFAIDGYSVTAGISIGLVASAGGIATEELVRRADVAMYAAKANGRDCCCLYAAAMDEEYDERRRLERDLSHAIAQGGIEVHFQPVVEARGRRIVGVEALARWTHPRHGPIAPDLFIRVAERSGLINDLGRCVLVSACRAALAWDVELAVNLSPAQFWDRTLVNRIATVLHETGFPAARLELEITETYLLRRPDAAEEVLRDLRTLGIRISLDDFGTGFASIGYLRRLSFDRIKIDRSFVTDVASDGRAADLARAITALAEALDLSVTAEGIETEAQAAIMRTVGCARMQGWLFGRPVPAAEMAGILEGERIAARA